MQFASSRLWSSPMDGHDQTQTQTWSLARSGASAKTSPHLSPQTGLYWLQHRRDTLPAPGQHKVQAVRIRLAQKEKCPRLCLHSLPNRRPCARTAKAPSRNCVYWPRRREKGSPARSPPQDAWLWQWQGGINSQLNRKVILCFQYETFHTIKSNPKDFLDSVFTHF